MGFPGKIQQWKTVCLVFSIWILGGFAATNCNVYTPAFPPPPYDAKSQIIQQAKAEIQAVLQDVIDEGDYETTVFSASITSKTETLFEFHHTPSDKDRDRPGALITDGKTCYMIASCTKLFTVLALLQLQKAGKLQLDDPVNKYVAELNGPQNGTLPWKDITLRSLASQMSGIPRDMAEDDMLVDVADPVSYGFPALSPSENHAIQCDQMTNYSRPCGRADLIYRLKNALPIFAPKQQSTYSNLNFALLSLVLENVTSMPYVDLIQTQVLDKLDMTSTSFDAPDDSVAALPKHEFGYWGTNMGIQNATGGLYSSTDDLNKFIRHVLTVYNGVSSAQNWIHPVSYSTGLNNFYGMPWEIFRTTEIFDYTNRPVTFLTKAGGEPGYSSEIVVVPDYEFGYSILVGGEGGIIDTATESIGVIMTRAIEALAQLNLKAKYTGSWSAPAHSDVNSSIELSHTLERGLWVSYWVSNSIDVLSNLGPASFPGARDSAGRHQYLQLVPTLLYKDAKNQKGEIWRSLAHRTPGHDGRYTGYKGVFRDFCVTDIDEEQYGGEPYNEVVFWDKKEDGTFGSVELTGYRITLERDGMKQGEENEKITVQI